MGAAPGQGGLPPRVPRLIPDTDLNVLILSRRATDIDRFETVSPFGNTVSIPSQRSGGRGRHDRAKIDNLAVAGNAQHCVEIDTASIVICHAVNVPQVRIVRLSCFDGLFGRVARGIACQQALTRSKLAIHVPQCAVFLDEIDRQEARPALVHKLTDAGATSFKRASVKHSVSSFHIGYDSSRLSHGAGVDPAREDRLANPLP